MGLGRPIGQWIPGTPDSSRASRLCLRQSVGNNHHPYPEKVVEKVLTPASLKMGLLWACLEKRTEKRGFRVSCF